METPLQRAAEGLALVRITRPEARNALNSAVRKQLAQHLRDLAADEGVRCAVIAGSDTVFAAGADLKAMASMTASQMMLASTHVTWASIKDFRSLSSPRSTAGRSAAAVNSLCTPTLSSPAKARNSASPRSRSASFRARAARSGSFAPSANSRP